MFSIPFNLTVQAIKSYFAHSYIIFVESPLEVVWKQTYICICIGEGRSVNKRPADTQYWNSVPTVSQLMWPLLKNLEDTNLRKDDVRLILDSNTILYLLLWSYNLPQSLSVSANPLFCMRLQRVTQRLEKDTK